MSRKGNILVIDDNKDILEALDMLLQPRYSRVTCLQNPKRLPSLMQSEHYDVIILDMNFATGANTGNEGLFWIKELLKIDPQVCIITITAYGDVDLAVRTLKLGATDFILKPWNNDQLVATIEESLKLRSSKNLAQEQSARKPSQNQLRDRSPIIGEAPAFQKVLHLVEKVAKTEVNVLITGENGTGKELIAREIHRLSDRSGKRMVSVDLGAISHNLLESELFGHVKGAFTDAINHYDGKFMAAHQGTLFLDEIGNLSSEAQVKLLAALQNREINPVGSNETFPVDIRLISATNADLPRMITCGDFREDLLYRINTIEIELPPLRERLEDIPRLSNFFLDRFKKRYLKSDLQIVSEALEKLMDHNWPGNVRELEHMIEKAVILAESNSLCPKDFSFKEDLTNIPLNPQTLEDMEKAMIVKVISKYGGNMSSSANELGVTRQTLYNKIKKYDLDEHLTRHG